MWVEFGHKPASTLIRRQLLPFTYIRAAIIFSVIGKFFCHIKQVVWWYDYDFPISSLHSGLGLIGGHSGSSLYFMYESCYIWRITYYVIEFFADGDRLECFHISLLDPLCYWDYQLLDIAIGYFSCARFEWYLIIRSFFKLLLGMDSVSGRLLDLV